MSTLHRAILAFAALMVLGFSFFISLSVTGFLSYKWGYRRGRKAGIEYVVNYLESALSDKKDSDKPKSDDETGNVGHFGGNDSPRS